MFEKETRTSRSGKAVYVCRVCFQDQSFNNCENDTMKLSVNEAKLTGLCARNCATIQQVLILKFAFGPEKLPGLSRNGPKKECCQYYTAKCYLSFCRSYVLGINAAFSFSFFTFAHIVTT